MSRRRIAQVLTLIASLVCVLFTLLVVVPEYRRHTALVALIDEGAEIQEKHEYCYGNGVGVDFRLPSWIRDCLPTRWAKTVLVKVDWVEIRDPLHPLSKGKRTFLDSFPELRRIHIACKLTPADTRRLSQLPNLATLKIKFAGSSEALQQLRGMKSLQSIDLYVRDPRKADMNLLLSCPNLTSITLAGLLDLEVVAELGLHPRLKSLSLYNGAYLKDTLFLYHEQPFPKHQFASLAAFSHLDSLYFHEFRPGDLAAVPALPSLTKLKIFGDVTLSEVQQLTRFPELDVVTIDPFATRRIQVDEIRESVKGHKLDNRFYFWLREDPIHEILVDLDCL